MIVKGNINKRSDFNGEFPIGPNTTLALNFKQIPRDYSQESSVIAEESEISLAQGYPRNFLDDINENFITLMNDLNESTGFTVSGYFNDKVERNLLEDSINVGDLSIANITSTANFPNDSGTARSISLFFNPTNDDLENTSSIFTQRISSNLGYHIGLLDGKLYSRAYNSSNNYVWNTYISEKLTPGKWYHIIICHDATNFKSFLNGIEKNNFTISGTPDYIRPYKLGNMLTGGYSFKGLIRSLCFISYMLSSEEALKFQQTFKNNVRTIPDNASITTIGTWIEEFDISKGYNNSKVLKSNTANDIFELSYFGNKIELYLKKYVSGGTANIYIDDEFIEIIDTYALTESIELLGTYEQNTKSNHKLKIEVITGYIVIDYFKIFDINYIVNIHGFEDLHPDRAIKYLTKENSIPNGIQRYEVDGIDERSILFLRMLNAEDDDLILTGGAYYKEVDTLFDNKIKVLDLSNGGYAYTNNTPSSDGGNIRAFVSWFKPSEDDIGDSAFAVVATQRSTTNKGYHIGVNPYDYIYLRIYDASSNLILSYSPSSGLGKLEANKWYQVVLVHDNVNYDIYINGGYMLSGTFSGTPDYTSNFWKFGVFGVGNGSPFYGQIGPVYLDSQSYGLWSAFDVADLYENAFVNQRNFPTNMKQELIGDWTFEQTNISYKELYSNSLDDEMLITFKSNQITIYGNFDVDGGVFDYYIDDVLIESVNTYDTSQNYGEYFSYTSSDYEQHILKIKNTSGGIIKFAEIYLNEGSNYIIDESGNENHCELIDYYQAGTPAYTRDDFIVSSLYEFGINFDNADYPNNQKIEINENVFNNLGDRFFIGSVIKPNPTTGEKVFAMFDNTIGSNNLFIRLAYYQSYIYDFTDYVRLYGDMTDQYLDLGGHLSTDKYYFFGALVDDFTDEITVFVFNITDGVMVLQTDVAFDTGTTYSRTNLNTTYINSIVNSRFGHGIIDFLIFEKNTEYTIEEIKNLLYSLHTAKGSDQITPSDILTIYAKDAQLILRKESINTFIESGIYYSKILDIGILTGSGKLNIDKEIPLGTSITDIQTRTSENAFTDSPIWSSWEDVNDIGIIASPNRQYIQIKFTMKSNANRTQSPKISRIQVLDVDTVPYDRKVFNYPITYSLGNKESIINCSNLWQNQEINGPDYITFDIPFNDETSQYLTPEKQILLYDETYIIRRIILDKKNNKAFYSIYAEATFYNLAKSKPVKQKIFESVNPTIILNYILDGTGWELNLCDITITRDFSIQSQSNPLSLIREIQKLFGGDIIFDGKRKTVSLLNENATNNGVIFSFDKNMENIKRIVDSSNLANRVYVFGENGLTINEVHSKEYVENDISEYVENSEELYCKEITNSYFSDAKELKAYADFIKSKYATPEITYELEAKDLSVLDGYDLNYSKGDIVKVFDEKLDINIDTRIISVNINVLKPFKSRLILSNQVKNLGDDITELQKEQQKTKQINKTTFENLISWFLQNKSRGFGWVSADYIKINGIINVGSIGIVNLNDVNSFLHVRMLNNINSSIISRLYHGNNIIIEEISSDLKWYKIKR